MSQFHIKNSEIVTVYSCKHTYTTCCRNQASISIWDWL